MALLREKAFKQRIPIIWKNSETYLHILDYPNSEQIHLLYFHIAHVKFQTHAKDLLSHTKFVESHTTHSVRTALRAGLFVHFEIHVKNDGIIQSSTMNLIFFSNFFDNPATHPALNH